MEEALSNDLILKCIFHYLPTRDLVSGARLVSHKWNRLATEALKWRTNAYVRLSGRRSAEHLQALEDCITSSTDFPFRGLELYDQFNMNTNLWPEKWTELGLLRLHGHIFTRLSLTSINLRLANEVLPQLLTGPFRNIESLTLKDVRRIASTLPGLVDDAHDDAKGQSAGVGTVERFERLKTVKFRYDEHRTHANPVGVDDGFLTWLWQRCPNVQLIEGLHYAHLPGVAAAGKLAAVKSYLWCAYSVNPNLRKVPPELLPVGAQAVSVCPCELHYPDRAEIRAFSLQFFQSWRTHLLESPEVVDLFSDQPKVEHLNMMHYHGLGGNLASTFPNLKSIRLGNWRDPVFGYGYEYTRVKDWIGEEPLMNVTTLELCAYILPSDWKPLSRLCPNVQTIRVDFQRSRQYPVQTGNPFRDYWAYFDPQLAPLPDPLLAYHFDALERLEIYCVPISEVNLDVLFTGLSAEAVESLRETPVYAVPAGFLSKVSRPNGSLLSFKGLKTLIMSFTMDDETTEEIMEEFNVIPVSHVAVEYGFKLIPAEMKTTCLYDYRSQNASLIRKVLDPLSDYVSFGHRDEKEKL